MATCFLYGNGSGGGSNLNFSVKTYASEEALLAEAPKENTIGVVTETAVPKWGFYASEPESPAEGEIFFTVATESAGSFNALKKNALTVYPTLCQQYVSGEWVRKIAYICKSGAWVQFSTEWNGELFDNGQTFDSITGGWSIGGDINDGCLRLNASSSGVTSAHTNNKIDVTPYNTMVVTVDKVAAVTQNSNIKFGPASIGSTSSDENFVATGIVNPPSVGTYELDISDMSGEYYITVSAYATNSDTRISRVVLKK